MNAFFQGSSIPACILNMNSDKIEPNAAAAEFFRFESEFAEAFREMLKKNIGVTVKKFGAEEFFLFYAGKDRGEEVFLFLNTADIEHVIFEMEKIKAVNSEIDIILDAIHDDILITDGKGTIIKAYPSFEKVYHVKKEEVEGKSIYELEKEGVFKPSVTAVVLEKKQPVTMMQENRTGRKIIVTAIPVKNQNDEIIKVVSFSRDLTDYLKLKEQYEMQEETIQRYSAEIEELREKQRSIPGLVANSKIMKGVLEMVDKVAAFDANILYVRF